MTMDTVNIEIAMPHNDFYNGAWAEVALYDTEREEYVDVNFFPELDVQSQVRTFLRKYVTIVEDDK